MQYLRPEEFERMLFRDPVERIVEDLLFADSTPFAFRDQPSAMQTLRHHLCARLPVIERNIAVIGSGKIGFSLDPENYPRLYRAESDIDVIIVDDKLFDSVWYCLLKWHYERHPRGLNGDEREWISERRRSIYYGWLEPEDLLFGNKILAAYMLNPVRDLRFQWFDAFRSLSQHTELARHEINSRLYRTWQHALLYHADGLAQIKRRLPKLRRR